MQIPKQEIKRIVALKNLKFRRLKPQIKDLDQSGRSKARSQEHLMFSNQRARGFDVRLLTVYSYVAKVDLIVN